MTHIRATRRCKTGLMMIITAYPLLVFFLLYCSIYDACRHRVVVIGVDGCGCPISCNVLQITVPSLHVTDGASVLASAANDMSCFKIHDTVRTPPLYMALSSFGSDLTHKCAASLSSPVAVSRSAECLALSQRAPSGFNVQPYRVVLVHSPQ